MVQGFSDLWVCEDELWDFSAHVVSASKSSFMFQPFRTNGHNPGVQQ